MNPRSGCRKQAEEAVRWRASAPTEWTSLGNLKADIGQSLAQIASACSEVARFKGHTKAVESKERELQELYDREAARASAVDRGPAPEAAGL